MELGKRIRSLRLARGIKQNDLARRIGIKPPSLSELETGQSKQPSGPVLAALCRELGTNAGWLLSGKGDPGMATQLTSEQHELVEIFGMLPDPGKAALLASARALLDAYVDTPSRANPFPQRRATDKTSR